MDSLIFVVVIAVQSILIIFLGIVLFFTLNDARDERQKLIAAFLSKNTQDYTEVLRAEKEPKAPVFKEPDEVPLSEADDELFDRAIENQTR